MIPFRKLTGKDLPEFTRYYPHCEERGCEYSFANIWIWGRQRAAFMDGFLVLFSQFDRFSLYPFPLGDGNVKPVLDAIIHDARARGIPCRISSMTEADCQLLEQLYPGQFRFHTDRDSYDYVYAIEDLATLRGKRYQSKRNFVNRFWENHPNCRILPLGDDTVDAIRELAQAWYVSKMQQDPLSDFYLEQLALERALSNWKCLELEGLVLMEEGQPLAMTLGSRLSEISFDIHFEKALDTAPGAYAVINQAFAQYLLQKYPQLQYLNREDDMGIPGLRKAKLSYRPHHLVEKHWARLWEDDDEN